MQNVHNILLQHFPKVVLFCSTFQNPKNYDNKRTNQMQSIKFCYINFMLDAMKSKSKTMKGSFIKELMKDDKDTIFAIMQDGSTVPAIDIDPEQSTNDIEQWIDNNPQLHDKVMLLMKG